MAFLSSMNIVVSGRAAELTAGRWWSSRLKQDGMNSAK